MGFIDATCLIGKVNNYNSLDATRFSTCLHSKVVEHKMTVATSANDIDSIGLNRFHR